MKNCINGLLKLLHSFEIGRDVTGAAEQEGAPNYFSASFAAPHGGTRLVSILSYKNVVHHVAAGATGLRYEGSHELVD